MRRTSHRSSMMVAILSLLAMLMALFPSVAMAQGAPVDVPPPASCGTFDLSCQLLGNKADLGRNVAIAENEVRALGCWSCKVFNAFGDVVFTSGRDVSHSADASLRPVIIAVATLFSLFYLGSAFVSGDASDLLSRWKVFWRLLIAVAVGSAWLSAGSFDTTWDYVYGPLLKIPLAVETAVHMPGGVNTNCSPAATAPANAPEGAVTAMSEMATVVCGANNISLKGLAFGMGLSNTGDGIIGSFVNAVAGIILAVVFLWIAITFPLRFIDVLLRLMVVGIVAPVLVVCAVFKPTRSFVMIGVRNVLYAGALFAFTGIMFKVGYTFLTQMIEQTVVAGGDPTTGALLGRGIVLIGAGVVFAAMIRMAPALAAEFSTFSGQSGGVGDAATGAASAVVTLPAKAVGMGAGMATAGRAAGSAAGASATKALAKGVTP